MAKQKELWADSEIPGFAFRLGELRFDEAETIFIGEVDALTAENALTVVPKADSLPALRFLAERARALWPPEIGKDGVGPAKVAKSTEAALRSDLTLAGASLAAAGEIAVEFPLNAPTIVARSFRAAVVLELNEAVGGAWLLRRCGYCDGLFPARRLTRGAVAHCSTRCRSMALRDAGARAGE